MLVIENEVFCFTIALAVVQVNLSENNEFNISSFDHKGYFFYHGLFCTRHFKAIVHSF